MFENSEMDNLLKFDPRLRATMLMDLFDCLQAICVQQPVNGKSSMIETKRSELNELDSISLVCVWFVLFQRARDKTFSKPSIPCWSCSSS